MRGGEFDSRHFEPPGVCLYCAQQREPVPASGLVSGGQGGAGSKR